ncbi:MAG: EamA family transporter [Acetobacteraceae bacterium]|nr:EamA family transporter [Acetobacteraceae bacterium]
MSATTVAAPAAVRKSAPVLPTLARARWMFAFLCVVWGTTWLAMKIGIATVPPGMFAGLRWSVAGVLLLVFCRVRGERVLPSPRLALRLVVVSVLMITLGQLTQLYGLKHITAGLAAVINCALTPLSLLGFAVAFGQEGFSPRQLGAIGLGVVGVVVLFGPAAFGGTLDMWEVAGALGVIAACLCYSLGSVMAQPMMRTLAPVQITGLTDLIGGVILLVGSLAFEPGAWRSLQLDWGWAAWLSWLFLLVPGSLISTTIYFLLIRDWGASKTGTYAFISPVIAVILGCTWFGEKLDWGDLTGMVLMLGAAGLALKPRRR